MSFAVRHRNDPTPAIPPLDGLEIRVVHDPIEMAAVQGRSIDEIIRRFADGHRAYVAYLRHEPAAWGWVASRVARIGELDSTFSLPRGERYLWNFVTKAAFRGLGIYPRLIDAIVHAESREGERFWIAYAPENHASAAGIRRAGFVTIAELSFDDDGAPAVRGVFDGAGRIASRVLGIPEATEALAPCWRCVKAGRGAMACAAGSCACDYQEPRSGCAA